MYIFECEDSLDGIFTGIYEAYASKLGHNKIRLSSVSSQNMELFCQYRSIQPDADKSQKVASKLLSTFGLKVYTTLCEAALSKDVTSPLAIDKAEAVYKTVVLGLHQPQLAPSILEHLSEPHICQVFSLSRATHNEAHHLMGFLRFQELYNGVLFARIHPKNHVLPLLAEHFCDRLPAENFMIYDENRQIVCIHHANSNYFIADATSLDLEQVQRYSSEEQSWQDLWCGFFHSIAIEARKNPMLQNQNIPKRFQQDAVEFTN